MPTQGQWPNLGSMPTSMPMPFESVHSLVRSRPRFQILTARRAPRLFTKRHTPARESPPSGSSLATRNPFGFQAFGPHTRCRRRPGGSSQAIRGRTESPLPTLLGGRTDVGRGGSSQFQRCGIRGFRVQVELRATPVKHQPEPFRQPSTGTLQAYEPRLLPTSTNGRGRSFLGRKLAGGRIRWKSYGTDCSRHLAPLSKLYGTLSVYLLVQHRRGRARATEPRADLPAA
jgi:hypothetical protein